MFVQVCVYVCETAQLDIYNYGLLGCSEVHIHVPFDVTDVSSIVPTSLAVAPLATAPLTTASFGELCPSVMHCLSVWEPNTVRSAS